MMPTSHTDAPVALPKLMQVMWATVNRVTRSGKVQEPAERVTPEVALKAMALGQHVDGCTTARQLASAIGVRKSRHSPPARR